MANSMMLQCTPFVLFPYIFLLAYRIRSETLHLSVNLPCRKVVLATWQNLQILFSYASQAVRLCHVPLLTGDSYTSRTV